MATVPRCHRRRKDAPARRARRQRRRRPAQVRRRRQRRPAPLPGPVRRVTDALLGACAAAFTRPTYERFVVLLLGAILTTGSRTVLNVLRTLDALAAGHP